MDRLGAMAQFVRVVEAGSFSAAARALGQGQPAVSKAVSQLENRLGVRLLNRTTRALMLTEVGSLFYERAKAALDAAEEAEAAARGAGAALTGRLRICAPVTFARLHIVPRLPEFMTAHPGLDIDLVLDDRRIDLIEEGVDVAIRAGPLEDSSLVATHLATGRRQVVGSPTFWSNHADVVRPSDLAVLPFIAFGAAPGEVDWTFARDGASEHVRMTPCLRVSALEGVREALFAGIGFAIISGWSTSDAIGQNRAETRLETCRLPPVDLWAMYPAGRQAPACARAFTDFLRTVPLPR
jgi:DNA-binding transcriptional LysR family regulator